MGVNQSVGSINHLADKIWFTRKARIRTSDRLLRNDFHAHVLLAWYSAIDVIASMITLRWPDWLGKDTDTPLLLAIISFVILVIALLSANRDFKGRGLALKTNYIQLQSLLHRIAENRQNDEEYKEVAERYADLLSQCENHAPMDDRWARVFESASDITRPPTKPEKAGVYVYAAIRFLSIIVLYVAPISAFVVTKCLAVP